MRQIYNINNIKRHKARNEILFVPFIVIIVILVATSMMYFPFVQMEAFAAPQETTATNTSANAPNTTNTTSPASMINVTAVVKNGTQSIMKDLNATRQAILSGNTTEAIKELEDAYQTTGALNVCATTANWRPSQPVRTIG